MDGNGRWAAQRRRPRVFGHRAGAQAVRRTVEACARWGVEALTLYAFSTENWARPADEVARLMALLKRFLKNETPVLAKNNIRLRVIGDLSRLDAPLQEGVRRATGALAECTGLRLNLAINYGGRDEIVRAMRRLAAEAAAGRLAPGDIDEARVSDCLDTAGLPEVDLLIRTAGEMRTSNFLPWQSAYAEFWSTEKCWPDFDAALLAEALAAFRDRTRRFGGLAP